MLFLKKRKEVKKMKPSGSLKTMMASLLTLGIITNIVYCNKMVKKEELVLVDEDILAPAVYEEKIVDDSTNKKVLEEVSNEEIEVVPPREEVYDGMTMEELTAKLDNILSSDLSGMGYAYAKYSIELGVDGIVLILPKYVIISEDKREPAVVNISLLVL